MHKHCQAPNQQLRFQVYISKPLKPTQLKQYMILFHVNGNMNNPTKIAYQ